jgi:DNA-directed RNA polymerase specialized sigma24 family protein
MIAIPGHRIAGSNEQSDMNWQEIYIMLRPIAKNIVYGYKAPAWRGQENDIAEDITQETVRKLFEYEQKVKRGESVPIHSLLSMMRVIAYNYGKDVIRHDKRVDRVDENDALAFYFHEEINVEECATENAYNEMLFSDLARAIAKFPSKQKQALLIDLAAHMSFEQLPTPLQKAFLDVDIQLQTYQDMSPITSMEHNRHTSLLAHAYKRVATLTCAMQYKEQNDYGRE